jgi:hypothetical protein
MQRKAEKLKNGNHPLQGNRSVTIRGLQAGFTG